MDNSIYVTLSRQLALFRDLDVTANNIANVNTTGFNAERLVFDDYLVKEKTTEDREKIAFANDPLTYRDTRNGPTKQTGNPLDVAINGPGYFQVQTPLGVRYTKAGNFQTNNDGFIVTTQGYQVLGNDGAPVQLPQESKDIQILGSGMVVADGQEVGSVGMVEFANEQALKRVGDNMYSSDAAALEGTQSKAMQGYLESSNVNGVTELVRLLQVQRSTGSTAKFIETMYDLERKTSNTYSRPNESA